MDTMRNIRDIITDETYKVIFNNVMNNFYRKYDREWVDTLYDAGNYLLHTVEKRIDEVLEEKFGKDFEQKVADAVWAMIEKEVDGDYEEYYLNAEDEEEDEE